MRGLLRAARFGMFTASTLALISCGGGGGGSSTLAQTPAPTVTLTASPTSVTSGQSSTLTWSSTNATSCTASGSWSGSEATSGTASTGALTAAATYTLACSGSGGSSQASATVSVTGGSAGNQVPIVVDPGPANSVNTLFTTVTICVPGTSTCQTIDHIQVDTGSSGLRILSSVLSSSITLPAKLAADGNALVECTQFVDGYSWGPIASADLQIAGETASGVGVQVIGDPGYANRVPAACSGTGTAENSVTAFGANGILGISVFAEDCGAGCVSSSAPGFYYSCGTTSCTPTIAALASQLPNPVTLFATDNNGVIIQLPSVPAAGAATLAGTLTFGIDTQANNASGSQTVLTLDTAGDFSAVYSGQTLSQSFLDSGSSGYYFNDSSLTKCSAPYTGFYCPSTTLNLSAALTGSNAVTTTVSFSVANAQTEGDANPTFAVFGNLAGTYPASGGPSTIDFGLPFYFGRTTYTAFEGRTTSGGPGPYVAF